MKDLAENGYLYVLEKDASGVVVLHGNLANYKGRLMADGHHAHYSIAGLRNKVKAYMEKRAIIKYTSEALHHTLWMKMMPQSMIMEHVKMYEMTTDIG